MSYKVTDLGFPKCMFDGDPCDVKNYRCRVVLLKPDGNQRVVNQCKRFMLKPPRTEYKGSEDDYDPSP